MKKRKVTVSIDTTYKYLQIWNGLFNLTTKELSILSKFIDIHKPTNDTNLCSVKIKKDVATSLIIEDPNTLNNYIKKFKDKKAIIKQNGVYKLNPMLNPDTDVVEITINR